MTFQRERVSVLRMWGLSRRQPAGGFAAPRLLSPLPWHEECQSRSEDQRRFPLLDIRELAHIRERQRTVRFRKLKKPFGQ